MKKKGKNIGKPRNTSVCQNPAKGCLRRKPGWTMFNLMLSKKRLLSSKKRPFGVLNMGCLLSAFWV